MTVGKDEFRSALSRFPSGVTVVTAINDGKPWGMTVSAFSSVSLEPPLILVCIHKKAGGHACLSIGSHFAVNILSEEQEMVSRRFASRDEERFDGTGFRSGLTGAPLLDGVIAVLECRVDQCYEGGDHTIVLGEVLATSVAEGKPLAYFRGGYTQLS
jgi:flavin reductase (DIM6/NTAB) family NADH-FMN oxidoreductase RutF